ncbi:MAG TPA: Imm39 family immunity protein [Sphingomonadaceae bacterium]|nr:Imm39 family immunity protein [Sphingomonadaceae bacterium]
MAHNRKLVLSGVALTKARIPPRQNAAAANRVRDELEREIVEARFLEGAPFKWVGLIIRYGLVDETEPHYDRINHEHGDLPLAIEIDTHRLLDVSEDEMASVYRRATLTALIHAGKKFELPVHRLQGLLEAL